LTRGGTLAVEDLGAGPARYHSWASVVGQLSCEGETARKEEYTITPTKYLRGNRKTKLKRALQRASNATNGGAPPTGTGSPLGEKGGSKKTIGFHTSGEELVGVKNDPMRTAHRQS